MRFFDLMSSSFFQTPKVMGILNVTPDSFSDGGLFFSKEQALERAYTMIEEGAQIIDIGGQSTRPYAEAISVEEELRRVIPLIETIRTHHPSMFISVDTSKAEVMREAIAAGANMINDVAALRYEGSLESVANSEVYVCLMHMQGEPRTMQDQPFYQEVVTEVKDFLHARVQHCLQAGILPHRILIDPGIGFGKKLEHNLRLIHHLEVFTQSGYPVVLGVSRKSLLGQILNKPLTERLYGGLTLAVLALLKGTKVIRTHDVAPTIDAMQTLQAVLNE